MKAISIWQPWASLLFAPGEFRKVYETRPRTMGFEPGERIAIHASKTKKGIDLCVNEIPVADWILMAKAINALHGPTIDLPLGCIIGTVKIVRTVVTDSMTPTLQERAFGDWRAGRVAIETREPLLFKTPIPFIGKQGVFRVDDEIIAEALVS